MLVSHSNRVQAKFANYDFTLGVSSLIEIFEQQPDGSFDGRTAPIDIMKVLDLKVYSSEYVDEKDKFDRKPVTLEDCDLNVQGMDAFKDDFPKCIDNAAIG